MAITITIDGLTIDAIDGLTVDAVKAAGKCQNDAYNGITAQELYDMTPSTAAVRAAVDVLRRYCASCGDDCEGCILHRDEIGECVRRIPELWELPKVWTTGEK